MKCCVMEVVKKRQPTRHIFHLFLTESSEQPGSIGPALVTLARAFGWDIQLFVVEPSETTRVGCKQLDSRNTDQVFCVWLWQT